MHLRLLILLPVLSVFISVETAFSQWAVIPGLVSAEYGFGVHKKIKGIGSCFGIESQLYGDHIITGLVCNLGTNKYLDFNEGYFLKLMYQFGLGNYTFGKDENICGFGMGFSGGLIEASNGYENLHEEYYHHFTGLGMGFFANVAFNRNIQLTYNYDIGGRIKLFPEQVSIRPEQFKTAIMTGNYLYIGFIVTIDNHSAYERFFFPNGY
jgi:hypothetical protein